MKKIIAILLAVCVCAMAFTACSGSNTPAVGGDGEGGATIVIGGIGPLTGDYANYGTSVRNGAQLAVNEVNAAGGIAGMTIQLLFEDSQGDPDSAVNAYGRLVDKGMNLSLGCVLSGENTSVVAAAVEDGIPILTPSASANGAIDGNDAAFRVCFKDANQGLASADYIADSGLASKVAVFYQSDIDYSNGLYESFAAQCAERGIEIVEVQSFTDSTKTDFSTQIAAIAASGVDVVFIPIYAAEASTFLTQAQGRLDGKYFFGCDGLDGILGKVSDPAQAENVMLLTPFAADDTNPKVQTFVSAYKDAYNATPDQFAAGGYDAIYAYKAAVEKAGITDVSDADFNAKVVAAMVSITVEGVTGTMTWDASGECSKPALAMIIHDGVAVLYTGE